MKFIFFIIIMMSFAQAKMTFMRENEAGKHIYIKSAQTIERITRGDKWHLYPDLSKDGKSIGFIKGSGADDLSIMTMNLKSRDRVRFELPNKGMILHPRFSGDGQTIFFSGYNDKIGFFFPQKIMNSQTGETVWEDGEKVMVYKVEPKMIEEEGTFCRS